MNVVITRLVVVNPSVIRVNVYTDTDRAYELAIPIELFTEKDTDGNVNIDGDLFQQIVSQRIVEAQNAAVLAQYMESLNLKWNLVIEPPVKEISEDNDGLKLAYGGDKNDNT